MPPADNRAHLAAAAARRAADTRQRVAEALRQLDRTGAEITFVAVADAAQVSRSWLYRDADIRAEIQRLRTTDPSRRPSQPSRGRSSDTSLRQRLDNLLHDNHALREENHRLREQVAALLGQQRAATTPHPHHSTTLTPCS